MNLAQHLAELRLLGMGVAPASLRPEQLGCPKNKWTGREGQALDLISRIGSANSGELAQALNFTPGYARVLLHGMWCKGALNRSGPRNGYRYTVAP